MATHISTLLLGITLLKKMVHGYLREILKVQLARQVLRVQTVAMAKMDKTVFPFLASQRLVVMA